MSSYPYWNYPPEQPPQSSSGPSGYHIKPESTQSMQHYPSHTTAPAPYPYQQHQQHPPPPPPHMGQQPPYGPPGQGYYAQQPYPMTGVQHHSHPSQQIPYTSGQNPIHSAPAPIYDPSRGMHQQQPQQHHSQIQHGQRPSPSNSIPYAPPASSGGPYPPPHHASQGAHPGSHMYHGNGMPPMKSSQANLNGNATNGYDSHMHPGSYGHMRHKSLDVGTDLMKHNHGRKSPLSHEYAPQRPHDDHRLSTNGYKASPPVTPASDPAAESSHTSSYQSSYSSYPIPTSAQQMQQQEQHQHALSNGYPHSAPSRSLQGDHRSMHYEPIKDAPSPAPNATMEHSSPSNNPTSPSAIDDRPRRRSHASIMMEGTTFKPNSSNPRKRSTSFSDNSAATSNNASNEAGGKTVYECPTCHKSYKHANCLHKHKWEHTEYWAFAQQFSMSKHQQVQLLEAASILVTLGQKNTPSPTQQVGGASLLEGVEVDEYDRGGVPRRIKREKNTNSKDVVLEA
ncbi:hypothetical protein DFJ77DRAFT_450771 [Powellomyces hirtus]|nr:hypothetical protein DFJ77DRAFT_450771 [Powellomyces hirtus]